MALNYTQLVAAVNSFIEDDIATTDMDTIIRMAEERIYHDVQLPALRKNVTGATVAGSAYLELPTDWLSTYSIWVKDPTTGEVTFLLNKDVSYLQTAYPDPTAAGKPRIYAVFDDDTLHLAPAPDQEYEIQMHYFHRPESIVTASTSWLGNNFESVLLSAALLEAAIYIKEEADMLANYQQRYQEALRLLKQLADGKNRQDAFRTPQTRYPVR